MDHVPSITATMTSLAQAQSPAIRAKVRGFLADEWPDDGNDRIYASIYRKLCLLVHMGLDVEPVLKAKHKNNASSTAATNNNSEAYVATARPGSSQPSSRRTDSSSEAFPTSSGLFGGKVPQVTTWSFDPAVGPEPDGVLNADEHGHTPRSVIELAGGVCLHDGLSELMGDEHGHPPVVEETGDDEESGGEYEYVYEIVPVQGTIEDGERNCFITRGYDDATTSPEEGPVRDAWKPTSLTGYAKTLYDEMQQSVDHPGANLVCANEQSLNPCWADRQISLGADQDEGQSMYINLNNSSPQGAL